MFKSFFEKIFGKKQYLKINLYIKSITGNYLTNKILGSEEEYRILFQNCLKKRKGNKGRGFKFVGFKTTWASKIIEKPVDQAKKCFSDVSRCLDCLVSFGNLDEHDLEQTYALAAVLLILGRICSQKPKCSVRQKVKKRQVFIAFFDF